MQAYHSEKNSFLPMPSVSPAARISALLEAYFHAILGPSDTMILQ